MDTSIAAERRAEFRKAWHVAQEFQKLLTKHQVNQEFVVLLTAMSDAAEVTAEMANDGDPDSKSFEVDSIFDLATSMIEDIYSRSNYSWYMETYAEDMKAFRVERKSFFVTELPSPTVIVE